MSTDLERSFQQEIEELVEELTPLLVASERAGRLSDEARAIVLRRLHGLKGASLLVDNTRAARVLHALEPLFRRDSPPAEYGHLCDVVLDSFDLLVRAAAMGTNESESLDGEATALLEQLAELRGAAGPDPLEQIAKEFPGIPTSFLDYLAQDQELRLAALSKQKAPLTIVRTTYDPSEFGEKAVQFLERLRGLGEVVAWSNTGVTPQKRVAFAYLVSAVPAKVAAELPPDATSEDARLAAAPAAAPAAPAPPLPLTAAELVAADAAPPKSDVTEQMQRICDRYLETFSEKVDAASTALDQLHESLSDRGLIDELFRLAHSMKGTAGTLGLTQIGLLGGVLEDVLAMVRASKLAMTPEICDVMYDWVGALEKAAAAHQKNAETSEIGVDVIRNLRAIAAGRKPVTRAVTGAKEPAAAPAPVEADRRKQDSPRQIDSIRVALAKIDAIINVAGELVSRKSALREIPSRLRSALELLRGLRRELEPRADSEAVLGETSRLALRERLEAINAHVEATFDVSETESAEVSALVDRLAEDSIKVRMLPLSQVFQKYPRMVRELGRSLGRDVHLEVSGSETEIDKLMLEQIEDPLLHLLRNAVDHGIESPADREAAGKPRQGTIRLRATHSQGRVLIEVADDGGGIRPDKVGAKAVAANLVSPERLREMSTYDILQFIFLPGFTTRQEVTEISGRGVGLDVVSTNIHRLQGQVEIQSELGKGTTFRLSLPLTISIVEGVIVRAGNVAYCVPAGSVLEVLRVPSSQISSVGGSMTVTYRGEVLAIRWLTELLGTSARTAPGETLTLMVLRGPQGKVGIVVDRVETQQEVVIKSLGSILKSVPNVLGVTVRTRGALAVVLDPEGLVANAGRQQPAGAESEAAAAKPTARPRVLVVEDSLTTREMIVNILENGGYETLGAPNGKAAWDKLMTSHYDLVVTDIDMPLMDGLELTRRIRQTRPELPVILITSLGRDEEKLQGMQAGANAYIVKQDFDHAMLLARARELVRTV